MERVVLFVPMRFCFSSLLHISDPIRPFWQLLASMRLRNAHKCSQMLEMLEILPRNHQEQSWGKSFFFHFHPLFSDFLFLRGAVLSVLEHFGGFFVILGLPVTRKCSKMLKMSEILSKNHYEQSWQKSFFYLDFCPLFWPFSLSQRS